MSPSPARPRENWSASFGEPFAALCAELRASVVERERSRTLLFDQVAALRELGFTGLRLPERHGGAGLSLEETFSLLIELAAADPNLAHIYRGHIAFVEGLHLAAARAGEPGHFSDGPWVGRLAAGDLVGNAQSERQETFTITTQLDRSDGQPRVSGTKFYTTGSIYADWILLTALDGEDLVNVVVPTSASGVQSVDDWDGFGQQLTGSGTTTFDGVPVDPADISELEGDDGRWHYLASVFQLSLLAVVAGIATAALDDTVAFVRPRRRTFAVRGESRPAEDPLVQHVVGTLSSAAHGARALVLDAARRLDGALAAVGPDGAGEAELSDGLVDAFRTQQLVLPLVLGATTELFEVGGSSAVGARFGLDRHWRNARTVASHNPLAHRTRAVGQFELTGSLPRWGRAADETAEPDGQETSQPPSSSDG